MPSPLEALRALGLAESVAALERRYATGRRDSVGQGTVYDHLGTLASQVIVPGLDRRELVRGVLRELLDPGHVDQKSWSTCAAATVQLWLALREPSEYARLVAGLASYNGRVHLAGGPFLQRHGESVRPDQSGRTPSSRLLQSAFMDFANGDDRYSNATDQSTRDEGPAYAGLYPDQFDVLIEAVTARLWDTLEVGSGNCADAVALIARATSRGEHVPVSLRKEKMMHRLLVERSDASSMHCVDPVGVRQRVPVEEFRTRLGFVSLPGGSSEAGPSLFVTAGETEAWVRLKTLQPALPDFCPGCGEPAASALEVSHSFGSLFVPACGGCNKSRIGGILSAFFVQAPTPGIVAVRRASDNPPFLEITARHPRWLTQLWRLNRGSGRNYLERW
ncbi:MAG: hypothetical protein FD180_2140 [Planctomycetota bacterium]|nr:MAG: hypothetical protein FD180_2140 [Planctomycetota bacterium]